MSTTRKKPASSKGNAGYSAPYGPSTITRKKPRRKRG